MCLEIHIIFLFAKMYTYVKLPSAFYFETHRASECVFLLFFFSPANCGSSKRLRSINLLFCPSRRPGYAYCEILISSNSY